MKPKPEELEDTTTPAITAELAAAGDRFFESFESMGDSDWRAAPDDDPDEEAAS